MKDILGNLSYGGLFIVSAPAGTGKTSLVSRLEKEFDAVWRSVSYTTRKAREGEKDKIDYYFVTPEEFENRVKECDFLEYAQVFDEAYGTSRTVVEQKRKEGVHVVLVIDTQGALQIMEKLECVTIFLLPPSKEELKSRLVKRGTESQEHMDKRIAVSEKELQFAHLYDYQIVNDDFEIAYQQLKSIIIAEELRLKSGFSRQ